MTRAITIALFGASLLASSAVYAGEKTVTLSVSGMDCAACPVIVSALL